MKRAPLFLSILTLAGILIPACEVENCPPNSMSYAHFALADQTGKTFKTSDTITIIGQIKTDVVVYETLPDGSLKPHTVHDSLISDTLINKEVGAESFKLPLSYHDTTRFIFVYHSLEKRPAGKDTIQILHRNKPYFTSLECGTMMFYDVIQATATHHRMDSLTIINPSIDNYEKENFKIYYTVTTPDE